MTERNILSCTFLLILLGGGLGTAPVVASQIKPTQVPTLSLGESKLGQAQSALEIALTHYLKEIKGAERRTILVGHIQKLREQGWSDGAIASYIEQLEVRKTKQEIVTFLERNLAEASIFGSQTFQRLWYAQSASTSKHSARALLQLAVRDLQLPEELSGQPEEIRDLLAHFSEELDPANDFWDSFAQVVQKAYPKSSLAKSDDLSKQVHQLRYLISAQQAQWVRTNYGKDSDSDAKALARYLATKDEKDTITEILGWEDSDYDVTFDLSESSRLHNKIAVHNSQFGSNVVIYPDYQMSSNIKVVMQFHTEFILDKSGHFLNELEVKGGTANGLINGASFNYADRNNYRHRQLDVLPIATNDPNFRKVAQKSSYSYQAPNHLKYYWQATSSQLWENSYFNDYGNFSRNGKSAAKLVKEEGRAFRKMIKRYRK